MRKPDSIEDFLTSSLEIACEASRTAHRDCDLADGVERILGSLCRSDGLLFCFLATPSLTERSKLLILGSSIDPDVNPNQGEIEGIIQEIAQDQESSLYRVYRSGKKEWSDLEEIDGIGSSGMPDRIPRNLEVFTEPIVLNNWVEGVLQFFWESRPDLRKPRETLCEIAACGIGRLIERDIRNNSYMKLTELHQILVENVGDHAIFMLDPEGRVMTWNKGARRITGYGAHDIIGDHYSCFFLPEARAQGLPNHILEQARKRKRIEENGWRVRSDGTRFLASTSLSALEDEGGNLTGFLKIVHDVTDKRELEKEVVRIGIQNQREIAQQIHDGIGQDLTGIVMLSSLLKRKLKKLGNSESDEAERLENAARKAQAAVRRVSKGLLPVDVSSEGLVHGLEELLHETEELCQVDTQLTVDGEIEIRDNVVATNLYYIAKEALNNEIRHGKATQVGIDLECHDHRFRMRIRGNGVGISESSSASEGIGMKTMKHRANIMGADLRIKPGEESGALVICTLELECETKKKKKVEVTI
ncbi:MAG: PAS domain S-box protein [Candidatus Omnitrophica bacterium]|nr:PAS domain S-box protein [Candidatus Omnitrophota bacterium]